MAAILSESPQGGSFKQSEIRIVLLGSSGAGKSNVIKSLLGSEKITEDKIGLCTLFKSEQAGRTISVVDTPGWDLIQQTSENIKKEIGESVSLCPPGPHALLLVLPIKNRSEQPTSTSEITAAIEHMKLLSQRIWRHTIVLFACDGVEESAIKEHIHSAGNILEKCGRRYHVLQSSVWESATQIFKLFKKIEDLMEENHGEFFIPQVYYELFQHKTKDVPGESEARQRRRSLQMDPPKMREEKVDSDEKRETGKATNYKLLEVIPTHYLKMFIVILIGVIGAFIGSVAGAQHGALGACTGIVFGFIVGVLLVILTIIICNNIYLRINP
ncbi:GTPase IMAP family member 9 [Myxocyprinus asiaticus]|uniref:GTPase IMAP family member 9 n=1 Tax=Myxocyprinus asiaticus TaxID=70543 RepID=UPI0022230BCA|nr:GTPase IMAP family member 9 [Myxocyprinus asiaticus]